MLKTYVLFLLMTSLATHGKVHQDETKNVCSVIGMCKVSDTYRYENLRSANFRNQNSELKKNTIQTRTSGSCTSLTFLLVQ